MRYGDLFTLNPITTVIQLDQADQKDKARELVARFVFTPTLAEQFESLLLPQLTFGGQAEGKGIFVVGNYGTGKSHVMSFISSIAEHADLLGDVRESVWRDKLEPISGKYRVHRCQIAGSTMGLYNLVAKELTDFAANNGFVFEFTPQNQVVNIKVEFKRFQTTFEQHFPNQGVMLVVDELLHYLESRDNDQGLVLDLSVLQALGEFCMDANFVFMAGLQQKLFENPKFAHISSQIERIRQRFNDFIIDSKGVAQLVETYLFAKDADQKAQIRVLLEAKAELYPLLAAQIEAFVALFPAHPRFIEEFQRVSIAERREILKTLTLEARELRDQDIPTNGALRLITADDYWSHIESNQGLRASQDVRSVILNVETLTAKINGDFGPHDNKEAALRLVRALGVNRLTTPDIFAPLGLTPANLVENLLWHSPIPLDDAEMLNGEAERLLRRVRDVANGQFLAESRTSGQFYIDPKLDRDYPHEVETRAATIGPTVAQRYLNLLFTRLLEIENTRPIQEGRLWEYALPWSERNVERPGWLFFGFPSQRSTAKPPKDFYLFFVPSQSISGLQEPWEDKPDEIYFLLETLSDEFKLELKRFAAASERAGECSAGEEKKAFEGIADRAQRGLVEELSSNASQWFEVRWEGTTKPLASWLQEVAPAQKNALYKTKIEAVAGDCLQNHFAAKYPDYPAFKTLQTEKTRPQSAQSAIEILCKSGMNTQSGLAVLNALELYDDDAPTFTRSPWLQVIKARLGALEPNQVLNHADLFESRDDRLMMKDGSLEAEWLQVVLVAGVMEGIWVLTGTHGARYDAGKGNELWTNIKADPQKVIAIARPQGVDVGRWKRLFALLELPTGALANDNTRAQAVVDFQSKLAALTTQLVEISMKLSGPLPALNEDSRIALDKPLTQIARAKSLLEGLQGLNTKAKMTNLALKDADLDHLKTDLSAYAGAARLLELLGKKKRELDALQRFRAILEGESGFEASYREFDEAVNAAYADPGDDTTLQLAGDSLNAATSSALLTYNKLKGLHSLNYSDDKTKVELMTGLQLTQLKKLRSLAVLNVAALETVSERIAGLSVSKTCTDDELLNSPTSLCPHTGFDPRNVPAETRDKSAKAVLEECQIEVDNLHRGWTNQLLGELQEPAVAATLGALKNSERERVESFLKTRTLPKEIDAEWLRIIGEALRGLKRKPIKSNDFARAVLGDGAPLKAEELRERFEKWLARQVEDGEAQSVRFALED